MDKKKTIQLIVIFTLLLAVIGGTLAYWQWTTSEEQNTNVTFTVTQDFSCSADGGGNISHSDIKLAPTDCTDTSRAIKRKVTVSPVLDRDRLTVSLDLWLNIHELGEGLKKSNNFRYVLTTSSNSCTEGTIVASGNFKGRQAGDKVRLISSDLHTVTPTPEEYYLYIWLNKTETNSNTMNQRFSFDLGGECNEVETLEGDAYALILENGIAEDPYGRDYELLFTRSETPIVKGSTYNGKTVADIYTGIETEKYNYKTVPWKNYRYSEVKFEKEIRPESTASWFYHVIDSYDNGPTIDLDNLNTSLVTDMSDMFNGIRFATIHNIDKLDTSKVEDMSWMFMDAYAGSLDLRSWDTSNVIYMSGMFQDSNNLSQIPVNVTGWDTSKVIDMSYMFYGYEPSGLSSWNTSRVVDMPGMLYAVWDVSEDLSGWDTSNVIDMSNMFMYCTVYSSSNISNWDVSNVENMSGMFQSASINGGTIDLSSWNVSNVTNYNWFGVVDTYGDGTLVNPNFGM